MYNLFAQLQGKEKSLIEPNLLIAEEDKAKEAYAENDIQGVDHNVLVSSLVLNKMALEAEKTMKKL